MFQLTCDLFDKSYNLLLYLMFLVVICNFSRGFFVDFLKVKGVFIIKPLNFSHFIILDFKYWMFKPYYYVIKISLLVLKLITS